MLSNNPLTLLTSVQKEFKARQASDIKVPAGTVGITVTVVSAAQQTDVIQLTQLGALGEYCSSSILVGNGHKRLPVLRGCDNIQVDSYVDVTLQVFFYRLSTLEFFAGQNGLAIDVWAANEADKPMYEPSTMWWSFKDNSSAAVKGFKVLSPAMLVACLALGEGLVDNSSFRGTVVHILPMDVNAQQWVVNFRAIRSLSVRLFASGPLEEATDVQTGSSTTSLANTDFPVIQAPQHAHV
jgi:hypothetical protein